MYEDGETACAQLSTEAADGGLAREVGLPAGNGCEEMLGGVGGGAVVVPLDVGETLENVTVEGGTATGEAGAANPTFVDEDGEWKVETLYGGESAGG